MQYKALEDLLDIPKVDGWLADGALMCVMCMRQCLATLVPFVLTVD
jgi:hypothetical protein